MGCCNKKRQAWHEHRSNNISYMDNHEASAILQNPIILYYSGNSSIVIMGKVTGNTYLFAGDNSGLAVDERDVTGFIEMGLFTNISLK